ncbi:MAG: sulfurtransferase TusA family protein [Candidatus Krumholzibacteria bacterium]|jgi:TusA-related sulfurtransferase|nr:sulfurtransferase TusA family protein [Candidatus Krumholzibacteria bacterium]MDP6797621.1 sulfurtransferase TusA family protein [Candidatus Krumholzibacteria bacterium]MDP7021652.1 sulfurtransferase TusA family protein [Candidatus Krumholzibacteria bacterium]
METQLDTRGTFCPVPVTKTAEALKALEIGDILEIVSDDIGVRMDLPAWCQAQDQELLSMEEEGSLTRLRIRKRNDVF